MANVDHPHGLNPVMSRFHDTPRITEYYANVTTAIGRGDPVVLQADGRVNCLLTPAGSAQIIGVAAQYNAALTTPSVKIGVYDDPDTIYEIQSDGTTDPGTVAAAIAHIGSVADLVTTDCTAASGQSNVELDYSDIDQTTGAAVKIVGLYDIVGNDVTLAHARYLVQFQKHAFKGSAITGI